MPSSPGNPRTNRDLRDPSHYSRTTSAFASADLGHFRGQYPSVNFRGVDELKQIVQPRAQPAPLVMCKEPLAPNSVKIDAASKQRSIIERLHMTPRHKVVRDVRLRENLSLLEQRA